MRERHRILAPEVIQSSSTDCGPAALTCLLTAFDIQTSYGRLREACQTDVDGTSIDVLENLAMEFGLNAEQIMLPADYLLLPEARATPSLLVVRLPDGSAHFVVLWARYGGFVQIMDPAVGRTWMSTAELLSRLYIHTTIIPESTFRSFSNVATTQQVLTRRLQRLGLRNARERVAAAAASSSFRPYAELEATARMVDSICAAGGLRAGDESAGLIESLLVRQQADTLAGPPESWPVPQVFWTVWPDDSAQDGTSRLVLRGAVLVTVAGRRDRSRECEDVKPDGSGSREIRAAMQSEAYRPIRELLRLFDSNATFVCLVLLATVFVTTLGIVVVSVLLRALIEGGNLLGLREQRLAAVAGLLTFILALLLMEIPTSLGAQWLGRQLEARLRVAFHRKIPRLGDRYVQSRLASDMAERCHAVQRLRVLPDLVGRFMRFAMELVLTTAGIVWLDPAGATVAILACVCSVVVPLLTQAPLIERDLRARSHGGALTRFYLDALIGLVAVRTHGAEASIRREHEGMLVEWIRSTRRLLRAVVVVDTINSLVAYTFAIVLLSGFLNRAGASSSGLLMLFWVLNIPALGQEIAMVTRQFPGHRNVLLRLLEPLGALEDSDSADFAATHSSERSEPHALGLRLADVHVIAGGNSILQNIDVNVNPGEHIAVVGPSGAGKSSLLGLFLGWHRPASGTLLVGGQPMTPSQMRVLRAAVAWVDPSVRIWNRSLFDNLTYGVSDLTRVGRLIDDAELRSMLSSLPYGLQSSLGEGGGLVSGGEGQRVRLARAMARTDPRLVLLDEPFRGLDYTSRRKLLKRSREVWADATLLCITHDMTEAATFPRVIVVDGGRIVEDASPAKLIADGASRFCALMNAEDEVRRTLWASADWRRLHMNNGSIEEQRKS